MPGVDEQTPGLIHLNRRLVKRDQATVPVHDFGFLYGFGLFETMRAYNGVIFRLEQHVRRLLGAAGQMGFASCLSLERLSDACSQTLAANRLDEARVRLTVTPGNGDGIPDPGSCKEPTVLVAAGHYCAHPPETYEKGFSAIVAQSRRCGQSLLAAMKSTSYAENLVARFEAVRRGADEALLLTDRGLLAEGSMSNLFLVKGGILVTPAPGSILPGIARADVLKLAAAAGMAVQERLVSYQELAAADEAFLTNSMIEVMPLTSVAGRSIGDGRPGPCTLRLAADYHTLAQTDTSQGRLGLG